MLGERLRPIIEPVTGGIGRALARAGLTPNMLTAIGLLGTLVSAWLIAIGRLRLAGVVLIPFVIVDVLDGATARATGRVTKWGGFFDAVADRIGDGALLIGAVWFARAEDGRLLIAALAALLTTMLVPYARAKAEAFGYQVVSGPGERAERAIILIAGLVFLQLEVALWVTVALTAYTFVMRVASVRRQARHE